MSADPNKLIIATWNLENWTIPTDLEKQPSLATRIRYVRPMLRRLNAGVLCLQEVHAQGGKLTALLELLKDTPYASYNLVHTVAGGKGKKPMDLRNLVVLSRYPVLEVHQYHNDLCPPIIYGPVTAIPAQKKPQPLKWERPILHVVIELPNGVKLHQINIHLKSKLPTEIPGGKKDTFTWLTNEACAEGSLMSSLLRVGQAFEVRMLVNKIFAEDPNAWICVVGDYNCDSDEEPATVIRGPVTETGNPDLVPFQLVPCENSVSASNRYTILHNGNKLMFDHVMASVGLHATHTQTFVHNETLEDESQAFASDLKFPRPDHAGVRVEFNLDHSCIGECKVITPATVRPAKPRRARSRRSS